MICHDSSSEKVREKVREKFGKKFVIFQVQIRDKFGSKFGIRFDGDLRCKWPISGHDFTHVNLFSINYGA